MAKKNQIGSSIISLHTVDSTNSYLSEIIDKQMAQHGLVVLADYQTKGRGQQGNKWIAEEGKNIIMSVLLDMSGQPAEKQFYLNMVFSLSVANLLMIDYDLPDVCVKWPNDILVGNKKIAGILIENIFRGTQWQYAICGVGLNVNQETFRELAHATSIKKELQAQFPLHIVQKKLIKQLNYYYYKYLSQPDGLLQEYNQMMKINMPIIYFLKNGEPYEGEFISVWENGLLELKINGNNKTFRHKEIEIIRA